MDFNEPLFKLWEFSIVTGVMMLWIVYLIYDKKQVQKKNDKLIESLSQLTGSISGAFDGISNLNRNLVNKIERQINELKILIVQRRDP